MSLQDQMQSAKAYIKAKDYDSARRILKKIDHPTANAWLAKIDTLSPPKPPFYKTPLFRGVTLLVVVALAGAILWYNTTYKYQTAKSAIFGVCIKPAIYFGDGDTSHCTPYADEVMQLIEANSAVMEQECAIVDGNVIQDTIDYPDSVIACLEELGLLADRQQ